jgi:hypothetical protein
LQAWIIYVGLGLVLALIQLLFLWLDGGLLAVELLPVIVFNGFAVSFVMALIRLLDDQAVTAVNSVRPVLDLTRPEFKNFEYRLSTMPFLPPLIAGLIAMVMTILIPLVSIEPIRYAALEQLPVFTVVYHIIDKGSAFLFGAFIYHTIRQLRLANSISSNHLHINLFQLEPLQAFSRLSASSAVGLVVFVYIWMLINPDLFTDPAVLAFIVVISIMAFSVFAWPLWGVHKLLEMEKEKELHKIDLHFNAVFSIFNQRIQDEDYAGSDNLNGMITSLEIQQRKIKAIPTWPWRPDTLRSLLTVIALPVAIRIIQFLIERAIDW